MSAKAYYQRAARHLRRGERSRAIPLLRAGLALDPASADLLFCLADQQALRRVLRLDPADAAACSNLGSLLQSDMPAAGQCFRAALVFRPGLSEGLENLGNHLLDLGDAPAAGRVLERAAALAPGRADPWNSLGNARVLDGDTVEAERCYRRAIGLNPRHVKALCHLAGLLERCGRLPEALAACEAALAVDPACGAALSGAVHLRRRLCDWRHFAEDEAALKRAVMSGAEDVSPFVFTIVNSTMEEQQRCARQWVRRQCRGIRPLPVPPSPAVAGDGRIRLGYLSADFYQHATAFLAAELFELHDRSRFELFAYSWGKDDHSPMRRRLEAAFDHFVDISQMPYAEAARRVRADGIHILVDVKGYTQDARTQILAYRPAPVQISFLAYPGTMGAPFIDAVIADPVVLSIAEQPFFDERIVLLPDCYQVNDRQRRIAAETPSRAECGLPEGGPVFACFNNSYKLTPGMFDIWMRLLATVPGSVLWLLAAGEVVENNLRREAARRRVAAERLVFAPKLPLAQHLARHRLADLFLDTLPYNAHTTASDALWAGLPVLTVAGSTFAGRVAASLLRAVGMPELVAGSLSDYEAIALRLAGDPHALSDLKNRLAGRLPTAPLFDSRRFTRNLEQAFMAMVANR